MAEKQKLQELLVAQRELIRYDVAGIKASLEPAISSISLLGKLFSRNNNNPILGTATNATIDLVVKRLLLGRAGWIKRLIIPFLIKNVSSHILASQKQNIVDKLFSFIGKKNGKHSKAVNEDDLSTN